MTLFDAISPKPADTRSYADCLVEQIARDTATLRDLRPDDFPGREFYEERIAAYRAEAKMIRETEDPR